MDQDLEKTIRAMRTVLLVLAVMNALSAWAAFADKPAKGKFKRAIRGPSGCPDLTRHTPAPKVAGG